MENNKMEQLPNYRNAIQNILTVELETAADVPECAHEWTVDATNENGGDEKIVKDSNGNVWLVVMRLF